MHQELVIKMASKMIDFVIDYKANVIPANTSFLDYETWLKKYIMRTRQVVSQLYLDCGIAPDLNERMNDFNHQLLMSIRDCSP